MKTELRARPHALLPDQQVFEVWHDGRFIATVSGADGPGVRVITRHPMAAVASRDALLLNVIEVAIDLGLK